MNKMTENYLITGYWGEPHVTAENDRGINAAIFGAGRFVLPVGGKVPRGVHRKQHYSHL